MSVDCASMMTSRCESHRNSCAFPTTRVSQHGGQNQSSLRSTDCFGVEPKGSRLSLDNRCTRELEQQGPCWSCTTLLLPLGWSGVVLAPLHLSSASTVQIWKPSGLKMSGQTFLPQRQTRPACQHSSSEQQLAHPAANLSRTPTELLAPTWGCFWPTPPQRQHCLQSHGA